MILNKPLTLLFLIACRQPAMTWAFALPTKKYKNQDISWDILTPNVKANR